MIRKWVLANQRSELWLSHVKNMIRPIRIANDVFSNVRKMIRPIRSHRGVWVSRQNSRLFLQLAERRFAHIQREKFYSKSFFSLKKWKTFQKWSGIVSFVSLSIKKTVESRRNNCGRRKTTRRKLMLCFLSELLCLPFISLSLYWNRPFYLNSLIFNCTFRTNS